MWAWTKVDVLAGKRIRPPEPQYVRRWATMYVKAVNNVRQHQGRYTCALGTFSYSIALVRNALFTGYKRASNKRLILSCLA